MRHRLVTLFSLKALFCLLAAAGLTVCSDALAQQGYALADQLSLDHTRSKELSFGGSASGAAPHTSGAFEELPAQLAKKITLYLQDVTVEEAIQRIADESGLRFVYGRQVLNTNKRITLREENEAAIDVIRAVIEGTDLDLRLSRSGSLILVKRAADEDGGSRQPSTSAREVPRVPLQGTISGTVTDAQTGDPFPGVNIIIEGTQQGTTTDANGQYTITGVAPGVYVLQASFVGYATVRTEGVEVSEGETTVVNFALQPTDIGLEEVVVTALGIDREARALGYSVAKVQPDEITVNRTPNFMESLTGKMAGVSISPMGSGPQGSTKVRIRGQSSFGGSNSPLIVIDGVPIDNTSFGVDGEIGERGSNRNSDSGDGFSSINPDNIESMTVLKGAAAAALYGSRAKDGAIIITTRNRAQGIGLQVGYTASFTTDSPLDFRDYQMEYGQGEGGKRPTSEFPTSGQWSFGEKFQPGMTQILFDGVEVPYEPQPNQLKEYYRNGSNLSNTLSIAAGGERGGFNISLANLRSQAILPGSEYERYNVGVGFTQNFADRFTFSGNMHYSNEDRKNPPNIAEQDYSPVVIYNMANSMPMWLLKEKCCDENGDEIVWSRFTNRTNPYFALKRFENNERDRVFGNLTARFDITDWLYIQGRIGQDYYHRDQEYNLPHGSQVQAPAPPGFVNGQYVRDNLTFREQNLDFLIGANRRFGEFGIDANFGGNQMYRRFSRDNVLVQDFFSRGLYSLANGRSLSPEHNLSEKKVNSLYGFAELSYKYWLYITGTLRNDWFSTLSPDERSILYPSIATSFVFSDALAPVMPGWLTNGKLRASYAEVGSDTDVAPYSNNLFYTINPLFFGSSPLGGISGSSLPNAALRPMRVSEWELGLELEFFNNLSLDVAYYDKTSSDQILNQQISSASGYTSRSINVGEAKNRGVEMLLSFSPIRTNKAHWTTSFNASYNTTKVIDLGTDFGINEITVGTAEYHGELRQVVGMPMNQLYGWGYLRDAQGRQVFNPNTGVPMRSEEQIAFGTALPKWVGGITNSFSYGNFSGSFLIDFKLGHKMISGTHINAYRHGLDKATLVGRDVGYVIGDGVNPDGSINTVRADVQAFYEAIRSFRGSEQSVFNAGSWQLRQITLGYDLTNHLQNALPVSRLRVSAVARNVAVLKKWVPHIHPDQNGIISDQLMGLEATGLPVTRSIGFTIDVGL